MLCREEATIQNINNLLTWKQTRSTMTSLLPQLADITAELARFFWWDRWSSELGTPALESRIRTRSAAALLSLANQKRAFNKHRVMLLLLMFLRRSLEDSPHKLAVIGDQAGITLFSASGQRCPFFLRLTSLVDIWSCSAVSRLTPLRRRPSDRCSSLIIITHQHDGWELGTLNPQLHEWTDGLVVCVYAEDLLRDDRRDAVEIMQTL